MLPPSRISTLFPYTTLFRSSARIRRWGDTLPSLGSRVWIDASAVVIGQVELRSEEHTSELQSRGQLVCRLLLQKKKKSRFMIRALPILNKSSDNCGLQTISR